MFNRAELKKLILPLIIEQFLGLTIGMADTIMVATAGEAAVSSVSLVDSINILLINLFAALATGGTIVASQYIGKEDHKSANIAAKQLFYVVAALSVIIMILCLIFRTSLLHALFGDIEPAVMENCKIYFLITSLSYPFIALYNCGAALFRAMGNSKVSMMTSILINIINLTGNAILIYGFKLGVVGAAIPTLVSRIIGSILILALLHNPAHPLHLTQIFRVKLNPQMIKNILSLGIPNGLESSMFQIGKILVQGLVASFGTVALAANAVCNSICSLTQIPGMAIGLSLITIVGQCAGAKRFQEAKKYILQLTGLSYILMGILNLLLFIFAVPAVSLFALSPETTELSISIIRIFCVVCLFLWPCGFVLPNGLRAASDMRYTMIVSICSMWVFRIGFSYLLGQTFGLGLNGVWIAMYTDWTCRSIFFVVRLLRNKWMTKANLVSVTE